MYVCRLFLSIVAMACCVRAQQAQLSGPDLPPAAPAEHETWSIHFQATSIGQRHGWFPSLYEGANSLPSHPERRVSLTTTIFLTFKPDEHWELTFDPEVAGGRGFGGVTGIAGFTNGEIPRVAAATPTLYPARAFVRYSRARLTVTAGKFAMTDYFDGNSYSHDPRTQFMNWSLMSNGAWDYPADTRGYTIGLAGDLQLSRSTLRAAFVMEPTTANGPTFDSRIARNHGVAMEYERRHKVAGRAGAARLLALRNRERAGVYREAVSLAPAAPDLGPTRRNGAGKYGFGFNVEQALSEDAGVFARYGWSDGKTETWAFTEIDRSASIGLSVHGARWGRRRDTVGAAAVRNYLSGDHRAFLAAGGLGFILGDGRLHYASERIAELYYGAYVAGGWTITLDYQRVANPAYNRDRGPVGVAGIRLHWER